MSIQPMVRRPMVVAWLTMFWWGPNSVMSPLSPFARRRLSHFGHHRGIVGYSIFPNLYGERPNLRISLRSDRATASADVLPHHLCRGKLTYRIGR
jgi:hypothetical protein